MSGKCRCSATREAPPGGNWIRFTQAAGAGDVPDPESDHDGTRSRLAEALRNAVVLGDSHGDPRQAAKILDGALRRSGAETTAADRFEALVYLADLARRLADDERAATLLTEARATALTDTEREQVAETLATADELDRERGLPLPAHE